MPEEGLDSESWNASILFYGSICILIIAVTLLVYNVEKIVSKYDDYSNVINCYRKHFSLSLLYRMNIAPASKC